MIQAPHSTKSTLYILAVAKFGSIKSAAARMGIDPNTLYRAVAGVGVSELTRHKIETVFGGTLELLQAPFVP